MIHPQAKQAALELAVKIGKDVDQINARAELTKNADIVAQIGNVADAVLLLVNLLVNTEELNYDHLYDVRRTN